MIFAPIRLLEQNYIKSQRSLQLYGWIGSLMTVIMQTILFEQRTGHNTSSKETEKERNSSSFIHCIMPANSLSLTQMKRLNKKRQHALFKTEKKQQQCTLAHSDPIVHSVPFHNSNLFT